MMIPARLAQHIVRMLSELLPEDVEFIVGYRRPNGEFETISTVGPTAQKRMLQEMAEHWNPTEVDNLR